MVHISFDKISVKYPVRISGKERYTMAALVATASCGRVEGHMNKIPYINAITELSLEIKEGDSLAIIGRNGAGKSTLLKTVAGILHPFSGTSDIQGRVLSLLSLGSGVNMELSARSTLMFIAKLLGLAKSELPLYIQDVYEFTELGEFFDLPLNTYSSGMLVRFMFGAATYKSSDIIVVDEIIGAGDSDFFNKAAARAKALFKSSKILLLSSHSPEITYELCNKAILMSKGSIVASGTPKEVWTEYRRLLAENRNA